MNIIDPETRADRRCTQTHIVAVIRESGEDIGHLSDVIRSIINHSVHYGDRCDTLWTEILEEYQNLRYVFTSVVSFQQGLYFKNMPGHCLRFSVVTGDREILRALFPI